MRNVSCKCFVFQNTKQGPSKDGFDGERLTTGSTSHFDWNQRLRYIGAHKNADLLIFWINLLVETWVEGVTGDLLLGWIDFLA